MTQRTNYLLQYGAVFILYLLGLSLAPSGFRWFAAPTWITAALLNYYRPDSRVSNSFYILMFNAGIGLILAGYRLGGVMAESATEPIATTLYGTSLWLLGFSGMLIVGYYAYVLRFLFWQRGTPWGGGRYTAEQTLADLTRTPQGGRR